LESEKHSIGWCFAGGVSFLGAINLFGALSDPILLREILDYVRQQLLDLATGNALSKRRPGLKQH
jgi:hypothetical protein